VFDSRYGGVQIADVDRSINLMQVGSAPKRKRIDDARQLSCTDER
jgi:hypothetical protein